MTPTKIIWIVIAICLLPVAVELYADVREITDGDNVWPDHTKWLYIRGIMFVLVSIAVKLLYPRDVQWWTGLCVAFALHFLLFDYSINLLIGNPFFYVRADEFMNVLPFWGMPAAQVFIRL
jgi:hypothetical protein